MRLVATPAVLEYFRLAPAACRCRLPNRLPPSYRGNAVRFLYQVVVRGRLVPAAGVLPYVCVRTITERGSLVGLVP